MGRFYELPKEFHPDFAFPGRKPIGPVEIDEKESAGLLRAWYFLPGKELFDSVAGQKLSVGGSVSYGPAGTGSRRNYAASVDTGSYLYSDDNYKSRLTNQLTLFVDLDIVSGVNTCLFGSAQLSGTDYNWMLYIDSSGNFNFFTKNSSGTAKFTADYALSVGTSYTLGGTYDGSIMRAYVNGVQVATIAQTGNLQANNLNTSFGRWNIRNDQAINYRSALAFNRCLSAVQMRELHNKTYKRLRPATPLPYFIPSVSGRTATLTKVLGGLTLSGSSTLDLSASLTKTLSALTLSSAASLDIDAQLNKSLSDLTLVSASTLGIQGSLSKALSDLTLDSTAAVTSGITGTLEKTLQAISLSSTGALDLDASVSKTLEAISLSSSAGVDLDAQVSVTLGDLTLSSDATVSNEVLGTLSSTLGSLSLSSTAVLDISASSSITLSGLSLTSTGQLDISASFSGTLEDLTLSAFGGGARDITLNKTLGSLTLSSEAKVVLGRVGFYFSPGESSGDDLGFYDTSSDSSGDKIGFFNS